MNCYGSAKKSTKLACEYHYEMLVAFQIQSFTIGFFELAHSESTYHCFSFLKNCPFVANYLLEILNLLHNIY